MTECVNFQAVFYLLSTSFCLLFGLFWTELSRETECTAHPISLLLWSASISGSPLRPALFEAVSITPFLLFLRYSFLNFSKQPASVFRPSASFSGTNGGAAPFLPAETRNNKTSDSHSITELSANLVRRKFTFVGGTCLRFVVVH